MKRKIYFVVTVADSFKTNDTYAYSFEIPYGNQVQYTNLELEYEQYNLKDPLVDAYKALRKWVDENHPGMDYRTYYWTLESI